MNKIYRTLWNVATQSWVVVSELAKAGGKTASGKSALVNSVSGFSFTLIAASVVLGSGQVNAAEVTGADAGGEGNYCFYHSPSQSVVCGDATTKTTDKTDNKPAKSVVIGFGATNDGETNVAIGAKSQTSKAASIAIGDNAKALDNQAIAIGQNATANSDWDISIGRQAGAEQTNVSKEGRNIAIGDGALKRGKGVNNNIALGTSAGDRLAGTHNVLMGTYVNADEAVQSALTAGSTTKEINAKETTDNKYYIEASNTVALGTRALATQLAAVAIGQQAKAFGNQSVAVGNGTKASGQTAIATGSNAHATGSSSIAIGGTVNGNDTARTLASDNFTIAMGLSAQATKSDAIAVGRNAKAAGSNTVSIGYNAGVTKTADEAQSDPNNKLEPATDAVFIGNKAGYKSNQNRMQVSLGKDSGEGVVGTENVTIGNSAGKNTKGNTNVAISSRAGQNVEGHDNFAALIEAGQNIKGSDNIAIGKHAGRSADSNAKLNISNTISLGRESVSLKNFGIAQGHKAKTDGVASIAIGYNAEAVGGETANIAIGENAKADASGAIVLGKNAEAKSLTVNNKKYGAYSAIVIGNEAKAIAKQAEAGKEQENPKDAIAIGSKAEAHYASTIALGFGAKSDTKAQAVSIGYNSNAKGYQAIAFGSEAKTTENAGSSIAFGTKAQTRASSSLAIGMQAETGFEGSTSALDGAYAVALGREAKAKRENTLAFGYKAVADHKDAVALGANSVTAEAVATNDATVNGFTYSGFAGKTPLATVSVGKASAERTITNVAAGRINATSTDAINGSQLYLALNALGNVGNTLVTNVLGGNAAINTTGDNAGTLTMSDIGGTGKGTIHDAIEAVNNTAKAAKTGVKAGKNIVVTEKDGPDGNKIYTVETAKEVEFDKTTVGDVVIDKTTNDITGLANKELGGNTFAKSGRAATEEQLSKAVDNTVNILGGNAKNENGVLSMTNIGDTGADNIHDAIKAVNATAKASKTTVVEGDNIKVTTETAADGSRTYTVATQKDVKFDSAVAGGTKIDNNGLTFVDDSGNKIANSPSISKTGIDAGNQKVVNVANGDVSQNSKDAVNGSQLFAQGEGVKNIIGGDTTYNPTTGTYTNNDIGGTGKNNINDAIKASRNEVKQGKNMVVTPTVGANGQTVYEVATADKVAFDEVKVGGITMDGTTNKISGIAKGDISENSTDAVNGSQLYELQQKIAKSGDNYNILNNRINKVDKDLRAGIAGANAAAGLPQAYIPGKSMVAVAAGTYKGQNAIALGMSRISDNGKVIIKLTGNTNSRGDFGASIGAGYQW
ncbi:YadA-like family protein [Pasteurella multocida]|uniref:YadA-like family protein n=1 Tax=Pasteurella multocida TaxID=747 RepID=UPI0028DEBA8D|nr:YadA-like family protein [Pasteurella multocida]MEB3450696.1 YadA-like family protein [Pasteurella multocida]MEB3453442.1 YadA-like family protein [Pasteurella multocida]MEB3455391.1 YadA-like family protein [Pasteurella multocida]MEB3459805.1 YadA-like family protein [Pasteurella multocida]MEB3462012.1 YadA-like family protein [Pasteurella multocida]